MSTGGTGADIIQTGCCDVCGGPVPVRVSSHPGSPARLPSGVATPGAGAGVPSSPEPPAQALHGASVESDLLGGLRVLEDAARLIRSKLAVTSVAADEGDAGDRTPSSRPASPEISEGEQETGGAAGSIAPPVEAPGGDGRSADNSEARS